METVSKAVVNCEKEIKKALEKYNCTLKVTVTEDFSNGQKTPLVHIVPKPDEPKK